MRRRFIPLCALLLALLSAAVAPIQAETEGETEMELTPFARHGALRVSGTELLDGTGRPMQLRGVSTHNLAWYPEYVNVEAFRTLRDDWGANAMRLAMYTGEPGGYLSGGDPARLEALVAEGVRAATELGLYVIIDWHILSDGDPAEHQAEAIDFFARMSARYAGQGNVIYELCNEPNGPVDWPAVRAYAEAVIPAIRANAPEALILCGTPTWSQDVDAVAAAPLTDGNVMYALHFYAATHGDALREKLRTARAAGTPVFVSEFSICEASGDGRVDYESAAAWLALIREYNLSYIGWNLANKAEAASLIDAACAATSDWREEDLSETGRWLRGALREDREEE